MRRLLWLCLLLSAAVLFVHRSALAHFGDEKPAFEGRKRPAEIGPGPHGRAKLVLREPVVQLVPDGRDLRGSFVLRNEGEGPLEVLRVAIGAEVGVPRVASGVGISSAERETALIQPGQERVYQVSWRWEETRADQLEGFLTVETNGVVDGAYQPALLVPIQADHRPALYRRALTLFGLAPLLLTLLGLFAGKLGERKQRFAAMGVAALVALVGALPLTKLSRTLARQDGGWGLQHVEHSRLFGAVEYFLGVDGLTASLLPIVGLTLFMVVAASRRSDERLRPLLVFGGVMASGASFFLVSQSLAISAAALIVSAIAGVGLCASSRPDDAPRIDATLVKTSVGLLISVVAFLAFAHAASRYAFPSRLVDGTPTTVTYALPEITREATHGHASVPNAPRVLGLPFTHGVSLLALFALASLGMLAPLHGWGTSVAERMRAPAGALFFAFTGLLSGAGFLKLSIALYPDESRWLGGVLGVVGVITLLLGALRACVEDDLRKMVGHLGVASGGLVVMFLATQTSQGILAAIALVLARCLALPASLLLAHAIVERTGEPSIAKSGGLAGAAPRLSLAWCIAIASAGALPGSGAFWALFLGAIGGVGQSPWLAFVMLGGCVVAGCGAARTLRLITGPTPGWWRSSPQLEPHGGVVPDLWNDELPWVIPVGIALLLLALFPSLWLGVADASVLDLFRSFSPPGATQVS